MTPKGKYKIKYILYRKDRVKKIDSKIKKIAIKKNMGWCNDSKSKNYNRLIKLPSVYNFEKLFKNNNTYDILIVLDYNMNPTIKNKGSAIFVHCSFSDNRNTAGCIALEKKDLAFLLKNLRRNTYVKVLN